MVKNEGFRTKLSTADFIFLKNSYCVSCFNQYFTFPLCFETISHGYCFSSEKNNRDIILFQISSPSSTISRSRPSIPCCHDPPHHNSEHCRVSVLLCLLLRSIYMIVSKQKLSAFNCHPNKREDGCSGGANAAALGSSLLSITVEEDRFRRRESQ